MTTDPTDQLSLALDATAHLVAAVRDDQWTSPTPCTAWQVRDLVSHIVVGNYVFASILHGAPRPAPDDTPRSGADLQAAYGESAAAVLAAFRQPGVLERVYTVPFGPVPGIVALHLRITEVLVHGWDLGRAIHLPGNFPEELAEQELAFSRGKLGEIPAERSPFAPPQPVAHDAPAIDRLAACLGRSVAAT